MQIHTMSNNAPALPAQDSNVVVSRSSAAPSPAKEELASTESKSPSAQHVGAAVHEANKTMKAIDANLQFAVDPETNMTVIKVVDISSNTVLKQIPAQEMIDIAQALGKMKGVLLKQEA